MEVLDKPTSAVAAYQPFYAQLAKLEADNTARGKDVYIGVRATPPKWPFGTEVELHGRKDFKKLTNPGQVSMEHDSEKLILAAMEAATA